MMKHNLSHQAAKEAGLRVDIEPQTYNLLLGNFQGVIVESQASEGLVSSCP